MNHLREEMTSKNAQMLEIVEKLKQEVSRSCNFFARPVSELKQMTSQIEKLSKQKKLLVKEYKKLQQQSQGSS